ncbi:MAG: hypothetical protein ACR2NU_01910, partial [Aeoliella sp.]
MAAASNTPDLESDAGSPRASRIDLAHSAPCEPTIAAGGSTPHRQAAAVAVAAEQASRDRLPLSDEQAPQPAVARQAAEL